MSENESQNVSRWLAEIQSLQRQIAELKEERSQAYSSVDNWRNAYDAEAQQRRRDTEIYQDKIAQLQQTIETLQSPADAESGLTAAELSQIQGNRSIEQLQAALIRARGECDRL